MATAVTQKFRNELALGHIELDTALLHIALMADGYQFNPVTHEMFQAAASMWEIYGHGYTTGGAELGTPAIVRDNTSRLVRVSWPNVSWVATGGNISAVGGVIHEFDPVTYDGMIIGFIDFGSLQTVLDGGTFTIANMALRIR
jgi:hypothetical protein